MAQTAGIRSAEGAAKQQSCVKSPVLTRRSWIAAASLAAAAACRRKSGSGFPGYALIATAGEESVAVIDLMHFRLDAPIPLGAPPTAVLTAGDGYAAYVLTPSNGRLHVIGPSRRVMGSLLLGPGVSEIRTGAYINSVYAITSSAPQLIRADASHFHVSRRYSLKSAGQWMDIVPASPGRELVAVSGGRSGWVEVVDAKTHVQHARHFDAELGDLRFRADAELLLVSNLSGRSLLALSVPDLELVAELPLAMQPQNLCFNSDQGQLFVTGDGMDGVAIVFPYRVLQVDQTVLAGRDPGVMACSGNPALLFVASASGSDVCVLHIDTRKVIGLVDVAQHPAFITITPDDQYALVLSKDSGDVAFIRIPTIRTNPAIVKSKAGASLFTMLPVGHEPVHAAVIRSRT